MFVVLAWCVLHNCIASHIFATFVISRRIVFYFVMESELGRLAILDPTGDRPFYIKRGMHMFFGAGALVGMSC